jgi:hypothetical protein
MTISDVLDRAPVRMEVREMIRAGSLNQRVGDERVAPACADDVAIVHASITAAVEAIAEARRVRAEAEDELAAWAGDPLRRRLTFPCTTTPSVVGSPPDRRRNAAAGDGASGAGIGSGRPRTNRCQRCQLEPASRSLSSLPNP